ncbi:transcriptional regulator [Candidatus Woesearchaeota archaeon CG10_big_fil_rev_8_21_14_0_10_32_9]|nr:MAG: transcriptional regulator [Candidatus Woesearchaeota archaeon CG10_big_fil_rev_8_21_14_0_10_32_9]
MFCRSYTDFFQALANKTNQQIIEVLLRKEMNVSEIVEATTLEQSKVSHSLKKLAECSFVNIKKKGKQRIYSLNKETIIPILKIADSHAKQMCPICTKVH